MHRQRAGAALAHGRLRRMRAGMVAATSLIVAGMVLLPAQATAEPDSAPTQTALPFPGVVAAPVDVAVNSAGDVFVANGSSGSGAGQPVSILRAGETTPTALPFARNRSYSSVAVDNSGNVFASVSGPGSNPVVLKAGTNVPVELELPNAVVSFLTVDRSGNLYMADIRGKRVLKLEVGASTPITLPFGDLSFPEGIAVDDSGNVFLADAMSNRVLELKPGASAPTTLPIEVDFPAGVAVDGKGNLYVADIMNGGGRVQKLKVGATTPITLPFTGIKSTGGVAVNDKGTEVYVCDYNGVDNKVLKLSIPASEPTTPPAPVAPRFVDPPAEPLPAVVGTPFTHTFTATGTPDPALTVLGKPDWLTLTNGTLTGTPTAPGFYYFTIAAANGTTPNATLQVTVNVTAAPVVEPPVTGSLGSLGSSFFAFGS
ncbi:hypothetical protein [Rhodococcus sp. ARC_M6]|uniref:hypothetical protein n=1 Tax=Rhodococcus sp. ARC_M6 TaxID=2928852 RepID=UPI001FB2C320|nr:hypothetical protein [Rhodococcus sp. ARC_M6]MCJ0907123.1 hypothetical protein [Rhodococcus sp. ARC_M6]